MCKLYEFMVIYMKEVTWVVLVLVSCGSQDVVLVVLAHGTSSL